MPAKIRILVAKPGLDGHDRGVKLVARALRDAGFEVLYTGLHQTPEQIARIAVQEDVDAIGISSMSGAHMTLLPRIVESLRVAQADRVTVFVGGIIPTGDAQKLKEHGITEVFSPGTPTDSVVRWVQANVQPKTLTQ